MTVRVGIGQDSHRFTGHDATKPCILGGLLFKDSRGMKANSDGDVIIHAICNAISSVTGEIILGKVADEMLEKDGITDSALYLEAALNTLGGQRISHVAITIEALQPKFLGRIDEMRGHLASLMGIKMSQVGITATTGEQLTSFGSGEGIHAICIVTTIEF